MTSISVAKNIMHACKVEHFKMCTSMRAKSRVHVQVDVIYAYP